MLLLRRQAERALTALSHMIGLTEHDEYLQAVILDLERAIEDDRAESYPLCYLKEEGDRYVEADEMDADAFPVYATPQTGGYL